MDADDLEDLLCSQTKHYNVLTSTSDIFAFVGTVIRQLYQKTLNPPSIFCNMQCAAFSFSEISLICDYLVK